MTERTAGPWIVRNDHVYAEAEYKPAPFTDLEGVEHPDFMAGLVALPYGGKGNARLIAAAPDLIDALLEVRDYLDDRADASAEGDPLEYRPNAAMSLLGVVDEALRKAGEKV